MAIKEKDKVKVEYEGRLEDGTVFDSTAMHGGQELEFIPGTGMLVPGFEKAVIGMEVGEEKEAKLSPEDAYGPSNPEYIQKVPKDKFPEGAEVGMQIGIPTPMGQIPATILCIGETEVELDMNPPMAGKTLIFKIKVTSIEEGPFDLPQHECGCGDEGCGPDKEEGTCCKDGTDKEGESCCKDEKAEEEGTACCAY